MTRAVIDVTATATGAGKDRAMADQGDRPQAARSRETIRGASPVILACVHPERVLPTTRAPYPSSVKAFDINELIKIICSEILRPVRHFWCV